MAADVSVNHEKVEKQTHKNRGMHWSLGCEVGISYILQNCGSVTFCSWLVCVPVQGWGVCGLNRINVTQPVDQASSVEIQHPPFFQSAPPVPQIRLGDYMHPQQYWGEGERWRVLVTLRCLNYRQDVWSLNCHAVLRHDPSGFTLVNLSWCFKRLHKHLWPL